MCYRVTYVEIKQPYIQNSDQICLLTICIHSEGTVVFKGGLSVNIMVVYIIRFFLLDSSTLCLKKHPNIFSCNLNKHFLISTIFGTNIILIFIHHNGSKKR